MSAARSWPPRFPPAAPAAAAPPALPAALAESRDRWRDFALLAADLAFETDRQGRLVFLAPDAALGWDSAALLGQPAETLLARPDAGRFPFRAPEPARDRRAWLRRPDGTERCLSFAVAPLLDADGRVVGARGAGADVTDQDRRAAGLAGALGRAEMVDRILARARAEPDPRCAVAAALAALAAALGAQGAALVDLLGAGAGGAGPHGTDLCAPHAAGAGLDDVLDAVMELAAGSAEPAGRTARRVLRGQGEAGQPVLAAPLHPRYGGPLALAVWRAAGAPPWEEGDALLAGSAAGAALVLLEHEALHREMAMQARTDPLTGLLNRRAFLEELPRHAGRLDRDGMPGTLMFADLDGFKRFNDRFGQDAGDAALRTAACLLRDTFRPTDLVARLGGDEFAVWLNGADQLTAAERAESLRVRGPRALADAAGPHAEPLTLSIGIAERRPGSMEDVDGLFRRADLALLDVKRAGRAHWRAAPACEI